MPRSASGSNTIPSVQHDWPTAPTASGSSRGHFEEGLGCVRARRRARRALSPRDRVRALNLTAAFAFGAPRARSRTGACRGGARRAAPAGRARRDRAGARAPGDDPERARQITKEAFARSRRASRSRGRHGRSGRTQLRALASRPATTYAGQFERALALGVEALPLMQDSAAAESRFTVLGNLGIAALRTGRWAEAAERLSAALALADEREIPSPSWRTSSRSRPWPPWPASRRTPRGCSARPRSSRQRGASSSRPSTSRSGRTRFDALRLELGERGARGTLAEDGACVSKLRLELANVVAGRVGGAATREYSA